MGDCSQRHKITFGWSHPNWSISQLSPKNISTIHRSGNTALRRMLLVLFPPLLLTSPSVARRKVLLPVGNFNNFCNYFFVCEAEGVGSWSHSLLFHQRKFSTIDLCTEATAVPRHTLTATARFWSQPDYTYQIIHGTSIYQFIHGYRPCINFDTGKIIYCTWSPLSHYKYIINV